MVSNTMAKSSHFYIRRSHRYLGLILGIQFLFWTIGGLYFSWSNMDEIHGDLTKKKTPLLSSDIPLISPSSALDNIKKQYPIDSLISIQLIDILGKPIYQIKGMSIKSFQGNNNTSSINLLADATTGKIRGPLTKNEATELAGYHFSGNTEVESVKFIQKINSQHEYREQPLPAYAVTFKHPSNTTVYVSSELGTVQKFRNDKWRIFDFLWMLHTMDYESRDNIGNILLRIFSIFGLITIFSGFLLYFVSSKRKKRQNI